ncbi:MAG: hypothetical protein ACFUZC_19885 [Chthoniobacteraceae bacterium]
MTPKTEKDVQVFKTGSFSTWLIYLLAALALGTYGLLIHFMHSPDEIALWTLIFLGLTLVVGCAILHLRTSRIEVDALELRLVWALRSTAIPFEQIRGFRQFHNRHENHIELVMNGGKRQRIGLGFKDAPLFLIYLEKIIPNLDRAEREAELHELFRQECLGRGTPEEKAATIKRLRRLCRAINLASMGLAAWAYFYPHPYGSVVSTLLAFPLVGLILLRRYEGVIRFYPRARSLFPRIDGAFVFPALALALRAALDWHVLEWGPFWPPFATILTGGGLFCVVTARELRRQPSAAALFAIVFTFYAFGATGNLNGLLADSPTLAFPTKVQARHSDEHDRITVYHLTVSPWGDRSKINDVLVSEEVYNRAKPRDTVEIQVRIGKFGIPFYQVR